MSGGAAAHCSALRAALRRPGVALWGSPARTEGGGALRFPVRPRALLRAPGGRCGAGTGSRGAGGGRCVAECSELGDLCQGRRGRPPAARVPGRARSLLPGAGGCHPALASCGPSMCTQRLMLCLPPINYA